MNDLFVGIWCLVSGIIMIWVGVQHIREDCNHRMGGGSMRKSLEELTRGLECCKACTNEDPFQRCDDCPYNDISVSVQDCRAVLCEDALEVIRRMQ